MKLGTKLGYRTHLCIANGNSKSRVERDSKLIVQKVSGEFALKEIAHVYY